MVNFKFQLVGGLYINFIKISDRWFNQRNKKKKKIR